MPQVSVEESGASIANQSVEYLSASRDGQLADLNRLEHPSSAFQPATTRSTEEASYSDSAQHATQSQHAQHARHVKAPPTELSEGVQAKRQLLGSAAVMGRPQLQITDIEEAGLVIDRISANRSRGLAVTDITSAEWCQQQVAYNLTSTIPKVRPSRCNQ